MKLPRLSLMIRHDCPDSDLQFARHLGAECVYSWVPPEWTSSGRLSTLRKRVENHGLTLYNVGCIPLGKNDAVHLNLPGRDDAVRRFQEFVTNLGEAGIGVTTFTWEPDQVWSSARGVSRGAPARHVDIAELERRPLTHGRVYEREELWDNYAYFMDAMTPVLRDAGVKLALHPNDPPHPGLLGGIPCLIHSADDYDRAFRAAPADVLGMEFCCGCWLEGRETMGDPVAAIRRYCAEDRVLVVHFRNVSAPLPEFTETFLDNGYADMYRLMLAFVEGRYTGTVTPDHTPAPAEPYGAPAGIAYAAGYIRALIQRARHECTETEAP